MLIMDILYLRRNKKVMIYSINMQICFSVSAGSIRLMLGASLGVFIFVIVISLTSYAEHRWPWPPFKKKERIIQPVKVRRSKIYDIVLYDVEDTEPPYIVRY